MPHGNGTQNLQRQAGGVNAPFQMKKVSARSDYMSVGDRRLTQTEKLNDKVLSPVMKRAESLPVLSNVNAPDLAEVEDALQKAELEFSTNSMKRTRRVERAAAKVQRQVELTRKQSAYVPPAKDPNADVLTMLAETDVSSLMYEKDGTYGDEKFFNHYEEIKNSFLYLKEYEQKLAEKQQDINLTDEEEEELLRLNARLKTLKDMQAYYSVLESLMMNRYYALLPRDTTAKLSYNELRTRLDKLYREARSEKRDELIGFYQNLIRMKELEFRDAKSVKDREKEYCKALSGETEEEDTRDPVREFQKVLGSYKKIKKVVEDPASLRASITNGAYVRQFFEVSADEIDRYISHRTGNTDVSGYLQSRTDLSPEERELLTAYYQVQTGQFASQDTVTENIIASKLSADVKEKKFTVQEEPSGGIVINDHQKKQMRRIQAWLIRHAADRKHTRESFVNRLIQSPPEQQLVAFYLVEHKRSAQNIGSDFYSALFNYTPDPEAFRENMSWKKLSQAVRSAMRMGEDMKAFGELHAGVSELENALTEERNRPQSEDSAKEQCRLMVENITKRGAVLMLLYRNAGLHEDMPPDMAEDPKLREYMYVEFQRIGELALALKALIAAHPGIAAGSPDYASQFNRPDSDEYQADEKKTRLEKFTSGVESMNDYAGYMKTGDDMMTSIGEYAKEITASNTYGLAAGGLSVVSGLLGSILAVAGIKELIGASSKMTLADVTAKGLSVAGDLSSGIADSVVGTLSVSTSLGWIGGAGEDVHTATSWLGNLSSNAWNSTDVLDQVTLGFGMLSVAANTIKVVASGVQLGRRVSSGKDIQRSAKELKKKDPLAYSRDERLLLQFLNHGGREVSRKKKSAAESMITGVLSIGAGLLASTGVLAPIAGVVTLFSSAVDFGYAKLIDKKYRAGNRKKAVDEYLHVKEITDEMLQTHPDRDRLGRLKREKLEDKVRDETLAMLGYGSYHECFRGICVQFAEMLYRKVFTGNLPQQEWNMYADAMKSLGFEVQKPNIPGEQGYPTIEVMVAKLME